MVNLHDIRYVRVGTSDLDSAIRFATDIVGLQLVAREGKAAYFRSDKVAVRGDTRDHTMVYFEGDPADQAIGFDLHNPEDLDAVGRRTGIRRPSACISARAKNASNAASRRSSRRNDPSGNRIEFVTRPYHSGTRFFPGRDAGVTHFSHIGLYTTDAPRDEKFWTRLCNARVSDWIGDAALLRIATAHHSLALFPAPRPGIQHINHQVEDVDDVMKSWYFLREKGVKILLGPGRHPLSTAVMLYFRGPDGMIFEYSCGVKHIMPEERSDLPPAPVPVRALRGVHVGLDARPGNLRLPARRGSGESRHRCGR